MAISRKLLEKTERELVLDADRIQVELRHIRGLLATAKRGPAPGVRRGAVQTFGRANGRFAADAAYRHLTKAKVPVHRATIYRAVVAEGFKFGGREPIRTFASIVSRDPRLTSRGDRGCWGLTEWPEVPMDNVTQFRSEKGRSS